MDFAARELGVDPAELRRGTSSSRTSFPTNPPAASFTMSGISPCSGPRKAGGGYVAGFPSRRASSEAEGKLRGLGICYYIESILGAPDETATIELTETGAKVYVGTQSNGQGHETVYAQLLHDQTGLPLEAIEIVQGDSDLIATGGGTGGSRSVTVQGMAMRSAGESLISGLASFLEDDDGRDRCQFRCRGGRVSRARLERRRDAAGSGGKGARAGQAELTKVSKHETLPGRSYPNGCHVAEVEIDRETGQTQVVRYTVVDDFGNLMNPMLAEGQVHGGVAQGIGQAITERVVYDADGQLLTATFMDYGMPRAEDTPFVAFHTEPVPSIMNPLGMKGCGEAGTVGALAAVANAVQDALWPLGIRQVDMPFTPSRVWAMLNEGDGRVAAE
jgi:carbon-monoxide dehydrogenase large subunit